MSEGKSSWGFALTLAAAGMIAGAAGGASRSAAPSPTAASTASPAPAASAASVAPPSRYDGMGARLLALSMGDTAASPALPLADTALGVIVATIPDPIDSHEDWVYDGFLEALRRAHERMGYVVDRMWLPWTARADSLVGDSARTRVREAFPGVLLFRALSSNPATGTAPRYRIVYLVGEVPTAGVHPRALKRALAEREQLLGRSAAGAADTLAVVGPTFSGSSRGLSALLAEWRNQAPKARAVSVATGSATGRGNRQLFERTGARFRSTVNSDETLLRVLERQVLPALWIERGELAILVEGSTYGQELERQEKAAASGSGYAAAPAKDPRVRVRTTATAAIGALKQAAKRAGEKGDGRAPLRMSFPLNIGTLREQYAGRAAGPGDAAAQQGVSFTLTDAARPMESPPVASALTAASVDLMLDDMARTLRTREIRAVAIAASDVRDRLFLASELRKRLRDMQFVVFEANGLYLSPQYNEALRGMMVLSSYPLLAETQMWSGSRLVVPFPFDHAEALYNATLLQLGPEGETRLLDYALPDGGVHPQAPPVWISVVGGSGLIPLGVGNGIDPYVTHLQASHARSATPDARIDFVWGIVILAVVLLTTRLLQRSHRDVRRLRWDARADAKMLVADCARLRGPLADQDRAMVELFRRAQWGSLRYQEALYRFLFTVAAVGGLLPPPVLVFAAAAYRPGWGWQTATMALTSVTAVGMLLAVRNSALALAGWWRWHRQDFSGRMRGCRGAWESWRLNVYGRRVVLALGIAYLVATLAYVVDVAVCAATDPLGFTLLFLRAWRIDGGMSPILPLALASAAFLAWCYWHLRRLAALRGTTAFEAACLAQEPAEALVDVDAGDGPATHHQADEWSRAIPLRVVRGVRQVRERLFRLVPHRNALWLAAVLLLACGLVAVSRYRAPENVAGFHPLFAFDAVYRIGLAGMVAAVGWGVYRLLVVWSGLSRTLRGIAGTPLVTAFERLPQRVARLTRLTFVGAPRAAVVAPVAATQWRHLHSLSHALQPAPAAAPARSIAVDRIVGAPADAPVLASAFAEAPRAVAVAAPRGEDEAAGAPDERAAAEADLRRMALRYTSLGQPAPGLARWCGAEEAGGNFVELARVLEAFWALEPASDVVNDVKNSVAKEVGRGHAGPSTSGRIRRTFSSDLGLWARAAEEYAAVQVVDYIEWAVAQIRVLALFLFAALLVLVLHESAYPYQPQSLVKLLLFVLLVVTVGAVLKVMVGMNRDDVLSRIAGTDPGKLTWDRNFIVNALIFGLVPLFTLISSEFPVVRSILFAWIYPIARMLGGGG